jgi:hypothetical protein
MPLWFDTPAARPECAQSARIEGSAGTHHERASWVLKNGSNVEESLVDYYFFQNPNIFRFSNH